MTMPHHVVYIPKERQLQHSRRWCAFLLAAASLSFLLSASARRLWRTEARLMGAATGNQTLSSLRANDDEDEDDFIDPCAGKDHLLAIVATTGMDLSDAKTRRAMCRSMPLWSEVTSLYGDKPIIVGLDTCQRYRQMLAEANATAMAEPVFAMPRVAGLHNSGTNALADTFFDNLAPNPTIHSTNPRVYNVPWRKHTPLRFRDNVTARFYGWHENKTHVLPVVVVRDPYRWMASMCKVSYNVHWMKAFRHCPNLVAYPRGELLQGSGIDPPAVNVSLHLNEPTLTTVVEWESLAHMWSDWNREYLAADGPRLIVRYEDTLYHAEAVFRAIADCAGVPLKRDHFQPFALKANAKTDTANDLVAALAKNGVQRDRLSRMIVEDLSYARRHLDAELMEAFHYVHPATVPPDSYAAQDLRSRGSG